MTNTTQLRSSPSNDQSSETLPVGWRLAKLNDLYSAIRGVTFQSGEGKPYPFEDSIACITTSGVQDKIDWDSRRFIPIHRLSDKNQGLRAGDILVSTANSKALVGKSCLVSEMPFPCTFGAFVTVFRPISYDIDTNFLAYWFRSPSTLAYFYEISANTTNISNLRVTDILAIELPLPPLDEQYRIAARLNEQMTDVAQARQAAEEQLGLLDDLIKAYLRDSLASQTTKKLLAECFVEVKKGVGKNWQNYPVIGATRAGVAPAKEKVGKQPERYKLVEPGFILYNPMRINIGSIAMLDEGDQPGITSPDYVVFKSKEGIVHPRWFYYWFRSPYGEGFIKTFARGAVRERMLFNRLANGEIELPSWEVQCQVAEKLKEIKVLKQSLQAQLAEINQLPSALLRQAF